MAAPIVGIIGAAITAYSQVRGYFEEGPDKLAWEYKESSVAQEYSKAQLDIARKLTAEATDPQAKRDIYKLLGNVNMTTEDFKAYTNEFAKIEEEIVKTGVQQAEMAVGQKLTDLVSRGVMSQEQADKIQAKSDKYIGAITEIGKKKIEADRIALARNHWMNKSAAGFKGASVLAESYTNKLRIATRSINSALNSALQGAGHEQQLTAAAAKQQLGIDLDTFFTKKGFQMGSLQAGLGMGGNISETQRGGGGDKFDMSQIMSMFSNSGSGGGSSWNTIGGAGSRGSSSSAM